MMTARGPMVLEFNCRLGDPETQPIMMRIDSDLLEAIEASIEGRVSDGDFRWSSDPAVCVVMSSGGYPGGFEAGKLITGIEDADRMYGVKVFHAGTNQRDGAYYTSGGRVLGVTARGSDLPEAVERAYDAVMKIRFDGMHYRKDIAARGLEDCMKRSDYKAMSNKPLVSIVMGSDSDLRDHERGGQGGWPSSTSLMKSTSPRRIALPCAPANIRAR